MKGPRINFKKTFTLLFNYILEIEVLVRVKENIIKRKIKKTNTDR